MGTTLTAGQAAYLKKLTAALPSGFPLVITSAGRTPREQASAMLAKVSKYGTSSLDIYSDKTLVARLLALPRDVSSWEALIRTDGMRLSRHLWGGALDLRTRDLTSTQQAQLTTAVGTTGGSPLVEEDHLHADLPALYTSASFVETGAKEALPAVLLVGAIAAMAITGAIIYRRRFRS
jgi:hypothetical protein